MNGKLQLRNITPATRRIIKTVAAAQGVTAGAFVSMAVEHYVRHLDETAQNLIPLIKAALNEK